MSDSPTLAAAASAAPRRSFFPRLPRHAWLAVLLAAVTLATFGRVVGHDFVYWDDNNGLWENPDFNPPTAAGLAHFWDDPAHGYRGFYVPVTYTVYWAAAHVARAPTPAGAAPVIAHSPTVPNPAVFHALNLAFHAAAVVLAFLVFRRLVRSDWPALFGAAIFALHPLQADPVSWAANMYTPLSGLLALAAVLAFLSFTDRVDTGAGLRRPDWRAWGLYAAATLCYALALLTKPTILLLPVVVAVLEIGLRGRRWRGVVLFLLPWAALAAADALLTRSIQPAATIYAPPLWQRPLVAADALAFYLGKVFLPVGLSPDYGRSPRWLVEQGPLAFAWLVPWAAAMGCWMARRRAPWLWVGGALFVLGTLPTLGLVPYEYQFYSTVADRYAYFSLLGPALAAAFALRAIAARIRRPAQEGDAAQESGRPTSARTLARPAFAAAAALCLVLAVLSHAQAGHWRDTRTLFAHALAENPRSLVAHRQLGFMLLARRNPADIDEALAHYLAALDIAPDDAAAMSNAGVLLLRKGDADAAAGYLRQAVRRRPREAPMRYNLGLACAAANRPADAAAAFAEVLRLSPGFADAEVRLADALSRTGDPAGAAGHYRAALTAHPDWPAAREGLARAEQALRDHQQAGTDPGE